MTDTVVPAPPASPAAVLGVVTDTVADLSDRLWAARSPAELLATVRAVETLRSVLDGLELAVVAEIDATHAAATAGRASTKDFLTAVAGGRKSEGPRLVALAKALTSDRAVTGQALAAGTLSRTQAEVIVGAIDRLPVNPALRARAEDLLVDQARTRDAADLARLGDHLLERLDPDGAERREEQALDRQERAAHLNRFLSLAEDGIGGVRLRGRGSIEDAPHLKTVLFSLAAPPTPPGPRPGPRRRHPRVAPVRRTQRPPTRRPRPPRARHPPVGLADRGGPP